MEYRYQPKRIPNNILQEYEDKIASLRDYEDWEFLSELITELRESPGVGYYEFKQTVYLVLQSPLSQMKTVIDLLTQKYDA